MILQILFLTCAAILTLSMAKMDMSKFSQRFEDNCFQNEPEDPFRVNGQDIPLSNTMENFIAMVEKFEAANPTITLKEELEYFISEYLFENIKIIGGKISERYVERTRLDTVESLWDPDQNSAYKPAYKHPFTVAEMCSLYFMISHSMLEMDMVLMRSPDYSNSSKTVARTDLNPDNYYPQEIGVVAVEGMDEPVSLSKVLLGLLVGLKNNRKSVLNTYDLHFKNPHPEELDRTVDSAYVTTLAEVLMLSSWEGYERGGLAGNGQWVAIPLNEDKIEGFCPMVYKQDATAVKFLSTYSYATVRGAADGLILGLAISKVSPDATLSQVLRMYYSQRGITVESNIEDINVKQVSFCNREVLMQGLESKLLEQMMSFGYLIAITENDIAKSYAKAKSRYDENKKSIYRNNDNRYCLQPASIDRPEDLPVETFLDIIVVMDSSNAEKNFNDQQLIMGHLAKKLDLKYSGSHMTILLDRKNETESGRSSKIRLEAVVNDTFSSSCAACYVGQIPFKPSTLSREDVIVALDQLLYEKRISQSSLNGVNGKVVIYFNYDNGDGRSTNNRVQGNVDRALRDFNLHHLDTYLYAVGLDSELLKKYAKYDPTLVFLGTDDQPEEVANKIFKKISYSPALLQYTDCEEAKNEKSATYENFVSPNKIEHYTMPAEYFYKSIRSKVVFESQNGLIRVCYNRGTMKPENEMKNCKDTTPTTGVEFQFSNPCEGFTKETCSPLYFAVIGKDSTSETNGNQAQRQRTPCKINDRSCSTLDQIKFKVSHEGIRCSGCLGLCSTPAIYLFAALLAYYISKRL